MAASRSPLAPPHFPDMPAVAGVASAVGACGLKADGAADLWLAVMAPAGAVAGVLTRSRCPSAPVDWCRGALGQGRVRAIVVNAGNANAYTGAAGRATVEATAAAAAGLAGCGPEQVMIASTGVIGEPLDAARLTGPLPALWRAAAPGGWPAAAAAIGTTDTFPKGASAQTTIHGQAVTVVGIAKGSGMIAPDMATMLAFVFTDAAIPAPVLQRLTERANAVSFNCLTVDGDTSTSDTLLVVATGAAGHPPVADADDPALAGFADTLARVMVDLARQVAGDGEGARKRITIMVSGAADPDMARQVGLAIANSPLVKTAIAGEDANWGRIVMAVGKSGAPTDRDRLAIRIGGVAVAAEGRAVAGYDETPVARHLRGHEIDIAVDLGLGPSAATVWTCDLTHGYIDINASYRS